VLVVVGAVVIGTRALGKVDSFQRVSIAAGGGSVTFNGTGGYLAYYEQPGIDNKRTGIPIVAIRLTAPSGQQMILDTLYGGSSVDSRELRRYLTYSHDGHDGIAVYQFTIHETGVYKVEFAGTDVAGPSSDMAFGRSIGTATAAGAVLVLLGVLALITALVLLIVGFVKRGRHKRALATPAYGYAYPPPAPYGGPAAGPYLAGPPPPAAGGYWAQHPQAGPPPISPWARPGGPGETPAEAPRDAPPEAPPEPPSRG
jgi:hypothetical protein